MNRIGRRTLIAMGIILGLAMVCGRSLEGHESKRPPTEAALFGSAQAGRGKPLVNVSGNFQLADFTKHRELLRAVPKCLGGLLETQGLQRQSIIQGWLGLVGFCAWHSGSPDDRRERNTLSHR